MQLLDYLASYPDAKIRYHASEIEFRIQNYSSCL